MPKSATASKSAGEGDGAFCVVLFILGLGIWGRFALFKSPSAPYKSPKFTIIGANLTEFSYAESHHILIYNLALTINLTNLNEKFTHEFSNVKVYAYYQDKRFGVATLIDKWTWFHQDPKNITIFQNVVLKGQKDLVFDEPVIPAAAHDDTLTYSIDVGITFNKSSFKFEIICNLKLPLISGGTCSDCYKITNCISKKPIKVEKYGG